MRRQPLPRYLTQEFQLQMARMKDCTGCRACARICPYGLDVPELLKRQLGLYEEFMEARIAGRTL